MENKDDRRGRKRRVVDAKGKIAKGEKVETQGPVGRKDGYKGRKEGNAPKRPENASKPQNGEEDDRGLGTEIIGSMLGGMMNSGSQQSNSSGGSLLGSLLGGGSQQSSGSQQQSQGGGLIGGLFGDSGSSGGSQQTTKPSGGKGISLKTILIIAAIAIVALLLFKKCGGASGGLMSCVPNTGDQNGLMEFSGSDDFEMDDPIVEAQPAISSSNSDTSPDLTVASGSRERYTQIKGNGEDVITLMVFMCGTDLESKYGMATNDLNEMLHATLNDDHLNIIVQTGGTTQWKNSVMQNGKVQRWRVRKGGVEALNKDLGNKAMTDPNTLSDFIKFCKDNYPANRYMLIFWDHGGGSLSGYGFDQLHSGTSMTLDKINKALNDGGVKFDFIGFDACLMATMETAVVTDKYADYLIGSEETEPGCGWYYTNWLTALSKNPSIGTVELGKIIIDDFNDVCRKNNAGDSTTLSITDLAEFHVTVPSRFRAFSNSVGSMLDSKEYNAVATARRGAREFGASAGINHIDLVHFAMNLNTPEANALVEALNGCIKYNRTSRSMANSYGMSIYFPFTSFKSVNSAVSLYKTIGMDSSYSNCLSRFASLAAGGQIATGSSTHQSDSLFGSFSGGSSSSGLLDLFLGGGGGGGDLLGSILGGRSLSDPENEWFDKDLVESYYGYYDDHAIYQEDMKLVNSGSKMCLELSDDQWAMVKGIQVNVMVDDGEGYIDLGMDTYYGAIPTSGKLEIDYGMEQIALDGHPVAYYIVSESDDEGHYSSVGKVPALLNGELVDIIIVVDDEDPAMEYGCVIGARKMYEDDETDTLARGLIKLKDGDKIEFLFDYYSYDMDYDSSYVMKDNTLIVDGEIEVDDIDMKKEGYKCLVSYCITDIYGNEFWTEFVPFE